MRLLTILFILMSLPAWAHPGEFELKPPENLQTQIEITSWAGEQHKIADDELNRVWQELTSKLQPAEKDALTKAQLIWIKFRDAQAEADAAAYEGGSIAPYIYTESLLITTKMRTLRLRRRLDELIRLGN